MTPQKQNNSITLEEIAKRKKEIKRQLNEQKTVMTTKTQSLFSTPKQELARWDSTANTISKAIAIYDGVMLGFKLMKRFRGVFGKSRKI